MLETVDPVAVCARHAVKRIGIDKSIAARAADQIGNALFCNKRRIFKPAAQARGNDAIVFQEREYRFKFKFHVFVSMRTVVKKHIHLI